MEKCEHCNNGTKAFWINVTRERLPPEEVAHLEDQRNPDGSVKLWARWTLDNSTMAQRPCPRCGVLAER